MISHSQDKVFTNESGEEYNQIVPTLDKRGNKIVTRMADIIGYSRAVEVETGLETRLYMRGTTRYVAGSRFQDTPDYIVFNYKNLVDTIHNAVSKLEERFGAKAVTSAESNLYLSDDQHKDIEVEDLIEEFNAKATELAMEDEKYYLPRIQQIVRETLGDGKKIADATPDQIDLVQVALDELNEVVSKKQAK